MLQSSYGHEMISIELMDISGRIIHSETGPVAEDGTRIPFTQPGLYIVRANYSDGKQETHRILVE